MTAIRPDEYDAVVFDMDGVVLDGWGTDAVVHDRAVDDVLERRGLSATEDVRSALATDRYDDDFRAACETLGVDPPTFFRARERRSAKRAIERISAGERTLCADVDAIDAIDRRVPVALVSNNYHPTVEFVVEHFRLDAFAFVRGRDPGLEGFRRRKPDPHYLNEALDELGAEDGLYVGDRATDVMAAERAGLDSTFLRREHNASLVLDTAPTVEIGSLHDLVGHVEPATDDDSRKGSERDGSGGGSVSR